MCHSASETTKIYTHPNFDLAGLEKQNQSLHEEVTLVRQSNEQISEELSKLRRKYDDLLEGKDFMELLSSLAEQQGGMALELNQLTGQEFDSVLSRRTGGIDVST